MHFLQIKEIAAPSEKDSVESLLNNPAPEKTSTETEKRLRQELMEEDVPLEGQYAFVQLRRTLDDVRWKVFCFSNLILLILPFRVPILVCSTVS